MSKLLSLPAEHGGYLTAAGAGLTAAVVAPQTPVALAVGGAVLAAFLARGVVDRFAAGKPLARWDAPWFVGLVFLASLPGAFLARPEALATVALVLGIVAASVWARLTRRQRDATVETLGMTLLGASAGWIAWVAGAPLVDSAAVGLVLGAHAGLAVPLVRSELRKRELGRTPRAVQLTLVVALTVALVAAALGRPLAGLALLPRLVQAALRARRPAPTERPLAGLVGVRESVELVLTAGALVLAL